MCWSHLSPCVGVYLAFTFHSLGSWVNFDSLGSWVKFLSLGSWVKYNHIASVVGYTLQCNISLCFNLSASYLKSTILWVGASPGLLFHNSS